MLVAVSHRTSPEERAMYAETIGADAELAYLADLSHEARLAAARRADVLLGWNPLLELDGETIAALSGLRLVQLISAGADQLDPRPFPQAVCAANPGVLAQPIAEHVLALTLALSKRLLAGHEELRRGTMDQHVPSRTLRGKTVGIVGYGEIGKAVAAAFRPLDCPIMALNRSGRVEDPVAFQGTLRDLPHLLRASDVVVLTVALTPATQGLIGREQLSLLRDDAIFINVARAGLVDEDALYEHLAAHPRVLAGIDVWWQEPRRGQPFRTRRPFLDLPNVLGSPHNSGIAPGTVFAAARAAAENVRRFAHDAPLRGVLRREDLIVPG